MDNETPNHLLWKTPINDKQQFNIVLFFHDEHFDVITNTGLFFFGPKTKYCYECEAFYTKDTRHRRNCKGKRFFNFRCLHDLVYAF